MESKDRRGKPGLSVLSISISCGPEATGHPSLIPILSCSGLNATKFYSWKKFDKASHSPVSLSGMLILFLNPFFCNTSYILKKYVFRYSLEASMKSDFQGEPNLNNVPIMEVISRSSIHLVVNKQ